MLSLWLFPTQGLSQNDSLKAADSTYWKIENPTKNKFWGNSTYISEDANFGRKTEYGISIGRARGISRNYGQGMVLVKVLSWGVGYGVTPVRGTVHHNIKAFGEFVRFPPLILMPLSFRTDYFYQLTNGQHYLRPSVGLSMISIDIHFNYSFLLNGNWHDNLYRQGVTLRIKQFPVRRNWERRTLIRKGFYHSDN